MATKQKTEKYKKALWELDTFSEIAAHELRQMAKRIQNGSADISMTVKDEDTKQKVQKKLRWF